MREVEDQLYEFCRSDSLSEDGLREIIQRCGCDCASNKNLNIDNYKFFHDACLNELVTEGILRCLLKYFPWAAKAIGEERRLALHYICENKNVTLGMVQLLIDACPESVSHQGKKGWMPLHRLCLYHKNLDEEIGLEILRLLLERCPESVRHAVDIVSLPLHIAALYHADSLGYLPIHFAAMTQSPEFCRILIEAYPGSERITAAGAALPFHLACQYNTVATAKYFYTLYPESISVASATGLFAIYFLMREFNNRSTPNDGITLIKFLLDCDPDVAKQKFREKLPLYWVCLRCPLFEMQMENTLKVLQLLYDVHPEAIEEEYVTSNVGRFCAEVQTFINTQLTYARLARNSTAREMIIRDENGQVPLHRALRDNATLGSIKLLVKRNPSAVLIPDNDGTLPLHVACQHHSPPKVVDYLIGLDPNTLTAVDRESNTALHVACRGGKYDTIELLLEKYGAISVSQGNVCNKLPIHLLFESDDVVNREDDTKYLESVFRLLRANPETVMLPGEINARKRKL